MACTLYVENFAIPGLHDLSTGMCRTVNCQHGSVGCHPHQPQAQVHQSSIIGSSKPPKNTRGQALITASTTGAEFEASNKSSSTVAKSVPEAYDIFAHVCQSGTYIPVKRLQNLLIHEPPRELTIRFLHKLQSSLLYSDTFRSIAGGSV